MNRNPVWVPGSDRIVFRSDRNSANGIWMVRFQDGSAAGDPILLKGDAGDYTPLGVSRDGSFFYGLSHESSDIYSVEVDPRTLRALGSPSVALTSYPGRNLWPAWSPSGDAFGYWSNRETGGLSRLVIHHSAAGETVAPRPLGRFNFPPRWCGAGVIMRGYAMPFDANTGESLPPLLPPPGRSAAPTSSFAWGFRAALSADCRLAYGAHGDDLGRRFYRTEVSTGKETELLVDHGSQVRDLQVSPDGRWLAFYGGMEGGAKNTLMVLPTEGGSLRDLDIDDLHDGGFSWSPDSSRLMVSRRVKRVNGQGADSEFYWVSVEGGAPQSMGIRMNGLSAPSLNPDGKRLLFSSTETPEELWVLRNLPLK
jgi:Tol biopolymer transport system component